MKTKSRGMFQRLAKFVASALVVTVVGQASTIPTYAEDLVDLNAGVADAIDVIDIEMDDVVSEGVTVVTEDTEDSESSEEDQKAKSTLVMADVTNSLNVRIEPNEEGEIVGLLYADCGGEILEQSQGWTKIQSGELIGWASDEYLLFDEEAQELADKVGRTTATIIADALHVRKEPNEEAGIYGNIANGEVYETLPSESEEDWLAIEFEGDLGYINDEYVIVEFSIDHGETNEQIEEREEQERIERAKLIANLGAVAVGTTEDVLLAALVQCEAGNQSYEGQLAVAAVVMNRVRSAGYPNTVSSVIYASGQFTPAGNGKVEQRVNLGVSESCLTAARAAINGETNIGTATHFRRAGYTDGIVIGDHVFW